MMKRLLVKVVSTAVASWLLILVAGEMVGTKMGPLVIQLFFAPGFVVAAKVFPSAYYGNRGGHMPNVGLGLILDFVFIWVALLIVLKLLEKFIDQRREHA
jgi:hypothetical protein